jgi:hypothetical protein
MSVQTTYGATMTVAVAGQVSDNGAIDVMPMFNGEASAEIPFGRAVIFDGTAAADHNSALLPAAETNLVAGIVMFTHQYTRGTSTSDLGDTGVRPGGALSVLRKGRIWVVAGTDVLANASRLWVRAVAGGDPEFLGGCEDADDSTDMIDCTAQGVFRTTGLQGTLVELEVDFSREPT